MFTKNNHLSIGRNYSNIISFDKNFTDLIKFLCSIMVAIHHYSKYIIYQCHSENLIYKFFCSQGGYLGVAIFFLSGYGLMTSENKSHIPFIVFIKKRLSNVYLPVLLISLIWLPIYYSFIEKNSRITDIFLNLIWGWGDSVLWFVKSLFYLYFLFFIYSIIRLKTNNNVIKIIILCIFASGSFIFQYSVAPFSSISIPCFFIGIIIAEYNNIDYFIYNANFYLLTIVFLLICCIIFKDSLFIHASFNYIVLFTWIVISKRYKIQIKILPKWIGHLSYDIYLTHMKCLTILLLFPPLINLSTFTCLCFISAFLFYRIRLILKI